LLIGEKVLMNNDLPMWNQQSAAGIVFFHQAFTQACVRGAKCLNEQESCVGLPPVPFLPGRPVFQPVCPASRWNVCRVAICPVFWASCAAWL